MAVHVYNPSTSGAETGGLPQVQRPVWATCSVSGQTRLPCLNQKKITKETDDIFIWKAFCGDSVGNLDVHGVRLEPTTSTSSPLSTCLCLNNTPRYLCTHTRVFFWGGGTGPHYVALANLEPTL